MIIIADTSPLVALINIGEVEVLPKTFGAVSIPTAVGKELADPKRPSAVQRFIAQAPPWLTIRAASKVEEIAGIHPGEREAIALALELQTISC